MKGQNVHNLSTVCLIYFVIGSKHGNNNEFYRIVIDIFSMVELQKEKKIKLNILLLLFVK